MHVEAHRDHGMATSERHVSTRRRPLPVLDSSPSIYGFSTCTVEENSFPPRLLLGHPHDVVAVSLVVEYSDRFVRVLRH